MYCYFSKAITEIIERKQTPSPRPKPPPPVLTSTLQKSNAIAWFHRLGMIQCFVYIICQSHQRPRGERFLPGRWQPQGHAPAMTSTTALVIYPSTAADKRLMIGDCLPDSLNKIGTCLSFSRGPRDLRKGSRGGSTEGS